MPELDPTPTGEKSTGERLHVQKMLDPDIIERHIEDRLIRRTVSPEGYVLLNYTERAQWSRTWDAQTLSCRGLVLDPEGFVQSRPFAKFFNVSDHESPFLPDLPVEPFTVYEKVDGSMVAVSTKADGTHLFTTRGSFDSTQAHAARTFWALHHAAVRVPVGETWVFEYVAPWNRIVVDYGDREALILLAQLDNHTGRDLPIRDWNGPVAREYEFSDFDAVMAMLTTLDASEEGYVVRFQSGVRVKAKAAEYVRLHRLLTGVSAKTVWECLSNGSDLAEMVERVPDEFHEWVSKTAQGLWQDFTAIEDEARAQHRAILGMTSRKHQAIAIAGYRHKGVVFAMLDEKDHARPIWRAVKPTSADTFTIDPDLLAV